MLEELEELVDATALGLRGQHLDWLLLTIRFNTKIITHTPK